jgi:hypothetical protein
VSRVLILDSRSEAHGLPDLTGTADALLVTTWGEVSCKASQCPWEVVLLHITDLSPPGVDAVVCSLASTQWRAASPPLVLFFSGPYTSGYAEALRGANYRGECDFRLASEIARGLTAYCKTTQVDALRTRPSEWILGLLNGLQMVSWKLETLADNKEETAQSFAPLGADTTVQQQVFNTARTAWADEDRNAAPHELRENRLHKSVIAAIGCESDDFAKNVMQVLKANGHKAFNNRLRQLAAWVTDPTQPMECAGA